MSYLNLTQLDAFSARVAARRTQASDLCKKQKTDA